MLFFNNIGILYAFNFPLFFFFWKILYFVYGKVEFSYVFVSQGFQIVAQWKFKIFPYFPFVLHFYGRITQSSVIMWYFQSPLSALVSEQILLQCSTFAKIILIYIILIRCLQFKRNYNKYIDCNRNTKLPIYTWNLLITAAAFIYMSLRSLGLTHLMPWSSGESSC